jgi:hypothetical protein
MAAVYKSFKWKTLTKTPKRGENVAPDEAHGRRGSASRQAIARPARGTVPACPAYARVRGHAPQPGEGMADLRRRGRSESSMTFAEELISIADAAIELVVQILRLVPGDSAGQTAGIDPKRKIVATDSMSRIDV